MSLHGMVLIVGGRGSGKTLLLQYLERRHREQGCTFTVWDRLGHWEPLPGRHVVNSAEAEDAALEAIARAPTTLILDEIALVAPANGGGLRKGSAINEIAKTGRQAAAFGPYRRAGPVALLAAAQRPLNVHPDIRGLVDRFYLGRVIDPGDLDWVAKGTSAEVARQLPTLPVGRFITFDAGG